MRNFWSKWRRAHIIVISIIFIFCFSCKKDEQEKITNDFSEFLGIWVPYEILYDDGTILKGPFTTNSIFGAYDESIKINENKTYFPVIWTDSSHYYIEEVEAGIVNYSNYENNFRLTGGSWEMNFVIKKFIGDTLWLNSIEWKSELRLKRKLKL